MALGCKGREPPPLGRPRQRQVAVEEPREGQVLRLLPGEDGALEIRCEEGQTNEAATVRSVRRGVELGSAVGVAREHLVRGP